MNTVKKRQHYVWRNYLRPWSDNESIWTYFKEQHKIERPNLMGVAQEKYFYKLVDFTEEEEKYLKDFIGHVSHPSVKDFSFDFFAMFTITKKFKKIVEQNKNPLVDKISLIEEIRKMEINLMEDAHCKMENLGEKLIKYRNIEDLKTIFQDDYHFDGIMFLCFQYLRTKKMRNSVLEKFKGTKYEELMGKSWNILTFAFATTLTRSIALHENLKFVFIENSTNNHFLTGDQPAFNILGDKLNDKGEVADFDLYYPLTPKHAINIHFRADQVNQFESKSADNELIDYLNKKVYENSDYYVFADSKEQLEQFK